MAENFQDKILAFEDYEEYNIAYPVIVTRWEIKQVNGLNKQYLQVYFQKINNNVKAFQLNVECYSAFGKKLEQLSEVSIHEVDRKKIEFSEVIPLNIDVRRVEIVICQCLLTDGSIIEAHDRQMVVNTFKSFAEEDGAAGKRLMSNAIGYPVDNVSHWYCACGTLHNSEAEQCIKCQKGKWEIFLCVTEENLQKEKLQMAEQSKKKRKYIKIFSIVGAIVVAISVLVGSLVWAFAPVHVLHKYGMTFTRNEKGYVVTDCRKNRTSVEIPSKVNGIEVIEIGEYAFYACRKLTSVTIPDSVTSIGDYAFLVCIELESVTIPHSVTSIGDNAFESCISLTSIVIPDSVTEMGKNVFWREYGSFSYGTVEDLTIYCEVKSKSSGWHKDWNKYWYWNVNRRQWEDKYYPVVWGYKG